MIPKSELERRQAIFREKIEKTHVDLILATSQENFYYMTGALIHTQKSIPERLAIACMDKKSNPFAVVCTIERPLFKSESSFEDLTIYVEFEESPIKTLSDSLAKRGFAARKIGIETRHLVTSYYKELTERLPHAQFVSWDKHFDDIRLVKSPYEIDVMTKGARATEEAIYETWRVVKYGVSEKEMGMEMEFRLRKKGADEIKFLTCCSGVRTTIPHAAPSVSPIEKGDLIKVDFGGIFNGYVSDVARVAFMAEVSKERTNEYLRVVSAHKAIIEFMKPGVTASDVFFKSKRIYKELGLPFEIPHLGHSIGLTGHENPLIQPFDHTPLQPGVLIALEPRAKVREKDRYHVEDLVLITTNGREVLSTIKSIEDAFVIG